SSSVLYVCHRAVCHLHRSGSQFCTINLRILPEQSFLAVDFLDSSSYYSRDDGLHFLRNTAIAKNREQEGAAKFHRIPLSQCWVRVAICRTRSGRTARLVAIRYDYRVVRERRIPPALFSGSAIAKLQFPCGSSLFAPVEHDPACGGAFRISLRAARDHHHHPAIVIGAWT